MAMLFIYYISIFDPWIMKAIEACEDPRVFDKIY